MRRILVALGVLAVGATLAWAASHESYPRPGKPSKSYTIGVLVPQLTNPHFLGQAYGYMDEAERLGAKVILHDAGGYQYLDKQIAQIEDLIASKVDAICLVAVSGPGTVPVVDRAAAAGIPVVNVNVMTNNEKVAIRIRSDDTVIGETMARFLHERLKKGSVVMQSGPAGASAFELRAKSFRAWIEKNTPGIKILGERHSLNTPDQGLKNMEDFLQTFPQIDAVYNSADFVAIGAAQALKAAGKAGKVMIVTADFQPDTERMVREGVVTQAVVQQPVTMGRWAIRAAVNILEKREVPKLLYTPILSVTKDDVATVDLSTVRAPAGWKPK
ncbi:MAG: substrate-binding domain-containing protein [Candidatus Rokubacteria bacterium]|nr:substrate-binding domain-containing protein [Candidatus Rokubacteria bacterium]